MPHRPSLALLALPLLLIPALAAALDLAYGPYRTLPQTAPTAEEVRQEIAALPSGVKRLRTYAACPPEWAVVPRIAQEFGMQVIQGVHIAGQAVADGEELECLRAQASGSHNLAAGIVGNELLLAKRLEEPALVGLIHRAREATGGRLPLGTADSWGIWCNEAGGICRGRPQLAAAVDILIAHVHPYWETMPVELAASSVAADYLLLRGLYPGKKVWIGETGWPTAGLRNGQAVASVENQGRMLAELRDWSRRLQMPAIWFEAYDEPWKGVAEPAEAHWGLFDKERRPKHVGLSLAEARPSEQEKGGTEVEFLFPQSGPITSKTNCGLPVVGSARGAGPGWKVRLEVFTDRWYPLVKWHAEGLAPVVDGHWGFPDAILAGKAPFNDHRLRATLLDGAGQPVASRELAGLLRQNDCVPR